MATDYFLKIDGIDGESTDATHKNEIQVLSFSWGASNTAHFGSEAAGGGAGKVNMSDLSVMMNYSKASPKLMLACSSGDHIKDAILTARKAGTDQQEYLIYTLTEVMVSSYQTSASSEVPTDSVSLTFSKIEINYKAQVAKGTVASPVKVGWDLAANKKV